MGDRPDDEKSSADAQQGREDDARLAQRLRADISKLTEDPVQWIGDIPKTPWAPGAGAGSSKGHGAEAAGADDDSDA